MVTSDCSIAADRHSVASIVDTLGSGHTTQLFVHCCNVLPNVKELASRIPGLNRYAERALVLAGPEDIVFVHDPIDEHYLAFLAELGLGPRRERIVAVNTGKAAHENPCLSEQILHNTEVLARLLRLLKGREAVCLNSYFYSQSEMALNAVLRKMLGHQRCHPGANPDAVELANQKHLVRRRAVELGIPVAPGEVVLLPERSCRPPVDVSALERTVRRYLPHTGKVVIRGTCGSSGSATLILDRSEESIRSRLEELVERTGNRIYLVEVGFDVAVSPNIGMYIDPKRKSITCTSVTDQRLKAGIRHVGNSYPSRAVTCRQMIEDVRKLSEWLKDLGVTGHVGYDFCEHRHPKNGDDYFFVEINPRVNGATYPKGIVDRLNKNPMAVAHGLIEAFATTSISTSARSFEVLAERYGSLFFDPVTRSGIVPYNTGCLPYGTCEFAFLGKTRKEVEQLNDSVFNVLRPRASATA